MKIPSEVFRNPVKMDYKWIINRDSLTNFGRSEVILRR